MSAILSHPCALVPEHGDHYSNGFSDKGLKNYKISGAQSAPGALFLFLSMGCMPAGLVPMSVYDDRLVEMLTRLCEISHKTGSRSPPIAPRFRVRPPFPGHNAAPEYRQILQSLTAFYSSPGEAPVPFPYVNRILKGHGPYPPKALAIALTTPLFHPLFGRGFFLPEIREITGETQICRRASQACMKTPWSLVSKSETCPSSPSWARLSSCMHKAKTRSAPRLPLLPLKL